MDIESLDAASLAAKLEEVNRSNELLNKENAVLQSYLQRHVSPEEAEEWADDDMRRGRKGKGRKQRVTTLTIDQKLDIATAELDAVKKEAGSQEAQATKLIDALKAMLEQTDSRIATLKREAYEFKRDVVIAGEDTRTGKLVAEKVEKYFADQLRAKDNMIDKLHLKNQVLRSTLVRLETLLKQKEDVGDVLHYIDFHQLQIENKQYLAKIEEKNAELLRLKLSTGQTVQSLNTMKIRLSAVSKEMTRLRADIRSRGVLLSRLRTENERLCDAITSAQELGVTLARQAREASDMPTIMDYVELKTMQSALAAELSSWKRKLEVTELAATQTAAKMGLPRAAVEELARTGAGAPSSAGSARMTPLPSYAFVGGASTSHTPGVYTRAAGAGATSSRVVASAPSPGGSSLGAVPGSAHTRYSKTGVPAGARGSSTSLSRPAAGLGAAAGASGLKVPPPVASRTVGGFATTRGGTLALGASLSKAVASGVGTSSGSGNGARLGGAASTSGGASALRPTPASRFR